MTSYSQSCQDLFALEVCKTKSYIEIGAKKPVKFNNTYKLENNDFQGFSLELSQKHLPDWDAQSRNNKCYFENALTFDYQKAIQENNMNMHVGYLSCDIEPAANTFRALQRVISQGVTFDCITFEHDEYQEGNKYNRLAKEFMASNGYKVAVDQVFINDEPEKIYETWFVNNNIAYKQTTYATFLEQYKTII